MDLRPVTNPLHDQPAAAAVLVALIAAQNVWDITSSKIWFYIFTGFEYQSLFTSDDAVTCNAAWIKLIGVLRQERTVYQHCLKE